MSDNNVTISIVMCIAICVLAIITSCTIDSVTDSNNATKLVLNGVTPTQAYCAIHHGTENARCVVATIGGLR